MAAFPIVDRALGGLISFKETPDRLRWRLPRLP